MAMTLPDIRMAIGETSDGTKHLVVNLSGEFETGEEVVEFLRKSGEQLLEQGHVNGQSSNGSD